MIHSVEGQVCSQLKSGSSYFIRVSAYNGIGNDFQAGAGFGPFYTYPVPVTPLSSPSSPQHVQVSTELEQVKPITQVSVSWLPPLANGGTAITKYKVEWYTFQYRAEIQRLVITNTKQKETTGTFFLFFNGHPSIQLVHDVSATDVRYALMGINNWNSIGHVEVEREEVNNRGFRWRITFLDLDMNKGNQPQIQVHGGNLNHGTGLISSFTEELVAGIRSGGAPEIQKVTTKLSGTGKIFGYFRLKLLSPIYSPLIAYDAASEDFELALNALPLIGTVNVSQTKFPNAHGEAEWLITFEYLGAVLTSATSKVETLILNGQEQASVVFDIATADSYYLSVYGKANAAVGVGLYGIELKNLSVVPLPLSAALFLSGLGVVGLMRRKRLIKA